MKPHELRAMSSEELEVHAQDLRKELFNLKFRAGTKQEKLENPMRMRVAGRELARTLTIMNETSGDIDTSSEEK